MVIFRSQNKITVFFMILAWASPFKCQLKLFKILRRNESSDDTNDSVVKVEVRNNYKKECHY